jgi:cob(I)alamin adenosyltransferase
VSDLGAGFDMARSIVRWAIRAALAAIALGAAVHFLT